jgi:hypothetical protein
LPLAAAYDAAHHAALPRLGERRLGWHRWSGDGRALEGAFLISTLFLLSARHISSLSARGNKKPTWALPLVGEIQGSQPLV